MAQLELANRDRWELARESSRVERSAAGPALLRGRGPSTQFLDRIARPRLRPYGVRSAAFAAHGGTSRPEAR